jgi:hypothetical protein
VNLLDVSTRVGWPAYLGIGLLVSFLVWVLVTPDHAWRLERAFVGWQYRDGHRIELSTAGRVWVRFWAAVLLVAVVGGSVATVNWSADSRVETEPWSVGGMVYYVGDPVESPGCTVRVFVCLRSDVVFPIDVEGYEAFDEVSDGPDGLSSLEALPDDTNLLLYVDERFFPTHIVVDQAEQVTVSLYGRCAPHRLTGDGAYGDSRADCTEDPLSTAFSFDAGVVPVSLDEPLGGRVLIDGNRDVPIE